MDTDDITDKHKARAMVAQLEDGQTLEGDEKLSMSLEDMMAERIQRSMKRALGRGIRKALLKKMNIAAQILQNFVRRKANEGAAFYRGIRVALAQKLQKIYRGWGGKAIAQRLQREQAVRHAGLTLTRIARGMIARLGTEERKVNAKFRKMYYGCLTIQKMFRGKLVRWKYLAARLKRIQAVKVLICQRWTRGHLARCRVHEMKLKLVEVECAIKIQCMIRKRIAYNVIRENKTIWPFFLQYL